MKYLILALLMSACGTAQQAPEAAFSKPFAPEATPTATPALPITTQACGVSLTIFNGVVTNTATGAVVPDGQYPIGGGPQYVNMGGQMVQVGITQPCIFSVYQGTVCVQGQKCGWN